MFDFDSMKTRLAAALGKREQIERDAGSTPAEQRRSFDEAWKQSNDAASAARVELDNAEQAARLQQDAAPGFAAPTAQAEQEQAQPKGWDFMEAEAVPGAGNALHDLPEPQGEKGKRVFVHTYERHNETGIFYEKVFVHTVVHTFYEHNGKKVYVDMPPKAVEDTMKGYREALAQEQERQAAEKRAREEASAALFYSHGPRVEGRGWKEWSDMRLAAKDEQAFRAQVAAEHQARNAAELAEAERQSKVSGVETRQMQEGERVTGKVAAETEIQGNRYYLIEQEQDGERARVMVPAGDTSHQVGDTVTAEREQNRLAYDVQAAEAEQSRAREAEQIEAEAPAAEIEAEPMDYDGELVAMEPAEDGQVAYSVSWQDANGTTQRGTIMGEPGQYQPGDQLTITLQGDNLTAQKAMNYDHGR